MSQIHKTSKLLYKIAKAYYEDNLTQQQIAQRFGLSRIKVSRLLNRARADKVVQITIHPPQASHADLERAIEKKYFIKEAIVVTCSDSDGLTVACELGSIAADALVQCLHGSEIVGINWGSSLLSVVNALPVTNLPHLRVVQITGGLGELEAPVHGADLARRMAQAFGATLRLLHAPGVVKNQTVRNALVTDPQVADTLKLARQADVALVGIGVIADNSTLMRSNILTDEELVDLSSQGAVGDIALQFFDREGKRVRTQVDHRIVSTDLEDIKKIRRVIGVAGGREKTEAIRAVLTSGLVDVIVTDHFTAQSLIKGDSL